MFSSAFAVMARAAGIPARVVSGWPVIPTPDLQTVYTDQAHQWAEIALEGIGWVTVEPTPSDGAPLRARNFAGGNVPNPPVISGGGPNPGTTVLQPVQTYTAITQSPAEVRGGQAFMVSGTVSTATGHAVDDMRVEIFANKTQERGGRLIGIAVTRSGSWSTAAQMHLDMEAGTYQLLARAADNDDFGQSWSEPGIEIRLRQNTVTTITESPAEARWEESLTVAGYSQHLGWLSGKQYEGRGLCEQGQGAWRQADRYRCDKLRAVERRSANAQRHGARHISTLRPARWRTAATLSLGVSRASR